MYNSSFIVILHRIKDKTIDDLPYIQSIENSPIQLELFIKKYRAKGYSFVSLDQINLAIKENKKIHKWIAFTLDDGYADNLHTAYPIFKKHMIPFCIYITTSFIDRTGLPWWMILHDVAKKTKKCTYKNEEFLLSTANQKNNFCLKLYEEITTKSLKKSDIEHLITNLTKDIPQINIDDYKDEFLSWEQINTLSEDPMCTIGSHAVDHYVLDNLNEDEVRWQVTESQKIIEQKIGKPVKHFSYPNGSLNALTYTTIKNLNIFSTVTTTKEFIIDKSSNPYLLPRIPMYQNVSNYRTFKYLVKYLMSRMNIK